MALASIGGSAPSFRLAPVEGYAESAFKQGLKEAWRDEHYAEGYFALLIEWILRQCAVPRPFVARTASFR
jgi:hypothetical protein